MKFSKSIYKALFIIAWAVTTTACSEEQYEINKVEEGLPASVTLSLSVPSALETTMTRATDEQETVVERAAFLFYKKSQPDSAPIVVEVENLGKLTKLSDTHYKYSNITISETSGLTSGEWYFYAVANYGRNGITIEKLRECTKAEIDELCTTENQITDITETSVLMSGKYDANEGDGIDGDGSLTLGAGKNTPKNIKLKRLVAKSIFTIGPANSDIKFTLQSCELHKYPCSSTLMERKGWSTETNDFTNPNELPYKGDPDHPIKEKIDITNFTKEGDEYSFFFYTQENVQQPESGTAFTYNMREERVGVNKDDPNFENDYNTFKYAPVDATYVVVKGIYEGYSSEVGSNVTGNVTYTIHLGDFPSNDPPASDLSNTGSFDNFSIRRNVRYNYTVKIAGVNNIIVEALAQPGSGNTNFQHGAEGDIVNQSTNTTITVDAHYETVMLKLPTNLKGQQYALSVKTPYTNSIYTKDENASTLSIPEGDDIDWIKFCKPKSPTQFNSYPGETSGDLCDIKQLLKELEAGSGNHILRRDDFFYVTAYINEYYYGDESGNPQAGKKISEFVNADDREMTLVESMSVSPDGHSTYTKTPVFSIKQKSIKSCFDLEGCPNPFGIETIEETAPQSGGGCDESWYSGLSTAEKERHGYKNTCRTDNNIIGKRWSKYIDPATNGYMEDGKKHSTKMIYSIYQFLTRNRDLNGDDIIDQKEIRWYIPAHEQCLELWYGENSLPAEAHLITRYQQSSSSVEIRNYLTSSPSVSRTWWADEGSAFGAWKSTDYGGQNSVRVVRSLKAYNAVTTEVTTCENNVVTINYLADANIRTTSMVGNYAEHQVGKEADKLPRKFKIAADHLKTTSWWGSSYKEYAASEIATDRTIGNDYYENNDRSDRGKWRIPNEKELGLMLQYMDKIGNGLEKHTGGRTYYLDGDEHYRYYFVQEDGGKKFISTSDQLPQDGVQSNTLLKVRLVRDVE